MKVYECKHCERVTTNRFCCDYCRHDQLEIVVDTEQFDKLKELVVLVHGNLDNLIEEAAKDSICEIHCPGSKECDQLAHNSPDSVEYCETFLKRWFGKTD